jgi:hypothetical protein
MPLGKELEDWLDFGSNIFHRRASLYEIVMSSMDIYIYIYIYTLKVRPIKLQCFETLIFATISSQLNNSIM